MVRTKLYSQIIHKKLRCPALLIIILLGVLPLVSALEGCSATNEIDIDDVPCIAYTPVINCTGNISATNINESHDFTVQAFPNGDGRLNFTINFSIASYSLVDCANSSATIIIGHLDEDYNDKWLYFYGFCLFVGVTLIVLGYKAEDYRLTALAGFLILAFAVTFTTRGYPTLTDTFMRTLIILVSFGVGSYVAGLSSIKLIEEGYN